MYCRTSASATLVPGLYPPSLLQPPTLQHGISSEIHMANHAAHWRPGLTAGADPGDPCAARLASARLRLAGVLQRVTV